MHTFSLHLFIFSKYASIIALHQYFTETLNSEMMHFWSNHLVYFLAGVPQSPQFTISDDKKVLPPPNTGGCLSPGGFISWFQGRRVMWGEVRLTFLIPLFSQTSSALRYSKYQGAIFGGNISQTPSETLAEL